MNEKSKRKVKIDCVINRNSDEIQKRRMRRTMKISIRTNPINGDDQRILLCTTTKPAGPPGGRFNQFCVFFV